MFRCGLLGWLCRQRRADDRGIFGLSNVTIGIIVGALLLGAGAISVSFTLIDSGQDAAVKSALSTALTESETAYQQQTGSGQQSYIGPDDRWTDCRGSSVATGTSEFHAGAMAASIVAAHNLSAGSELDYVVLPVPNPSSTAQTLLHGLSASDSSGNLMYHVTVDTSGNCEFETTDDGSTPLDAIASAGVWHPAFSGPRTVWVNTLGVDSGIYYNFNGNDTQIRAGQVIRLGARSDSGATFCVIRVRDASDGGIGTGWQAKSEQQTSDGDYADCGVGNRFTDANRTATSACAMNTAGGLCVTVWADTPAEDVAYDSTVEDQAAPTHIHPWPTATAANGDKSGRLNIGEVLPGNDRLEGTCDELHPRPVDPNDAGCTNG